MNYSSLLSVLGSLEVGEAPSQVHGLLCGLLCSGPQEKAKSLWFSSVLHDFGANPEKLRDKAESIKSLDRFFYTTCDQLNDAEFGFQLLTEDEPGTAHVHLAQLADWCNGFTLGFGMGEQATASAKLPADTEELLADFQEIARFDSMDDASVEAAADTGSEEEVASDQSDVLEIEEFIKVGVLLINEEMRQQPRQKPDQKPDQELQRDSQTAPASAVNDPDSPTLH